MDSDDQKIVDGEVVDSNTNESGTNVNESNAATQTSADDLITVTNLIQSYIGTIDRATAEMKAHKQMLQDAFLNDPTYREHDEKVKEAVKVRTGTKQQILKQPTLQELSQKVKEMAQSVKDSKQALSEYLLEYARITGSREIEDSEGEIREIVYLAKLVKAASAKEFKKK